MVNRMTHRQLFTLIIAWGLLIVGAALAQTTAFTYQGRLTDSGNPANGNYDLTFKLFDTATVGSGTQQGATLSLTSVAVSAGVFTVQLDFGACASCFNGAARYLEIAVKPTSGSTFTTLSPRQPVTANPYAIKSLSAATADGLSVACVSCVTSSQIASVNGSAVTGTLAGSQISGAIPVASVPAGSSSYIQNTTTPQATANFNISGDGTAGGTLSGNTVNAAAQYNLGGARVLSVSGVGSRVNSNTFLGTGAGASTTPDNTGLGSSNSFFGQNAGTNNTTGLNNAFFGQSAGASTTTGFSNAFFGTSAGFLNTAGSANTFIGQFADFTTSNPTGGNNTLLGASAKVNSGVSNATAIGTRATVTQSNSLVLGSINGVNGATTDTKVGVGTTAPTHLLHLQGAGSDGNGVGDLLVTGSGTVGAAFTLQTTGSGGRTYSWISTSSSASAGAGKFGAFDATANGYRLVIDSIGNVGIGTVIPADKLEVGGDLRVLFCVKNTFGNAIAGTCSSDVRFKRDITPFPALLDKLVRLRPVHYYWRGEQFPDKHFGSEQSYGLIAQEVEQVLPELVSTDEQGYKMVNYSKLPLLTIQAVKELKAENDALRQRLNKQQAEVNALKKLVCQSLPTADLCKQ